jgi:hypothetical protein
VGKPDGFRVQPVEDVETYREITFKNEDGEPETVRARDGYRITRDPTRWGGYWVTNDRGPLVMHYVKGSDLIALVQ